MTEEPVSTNPFQNAAVAAAPRGGAMTAAGQAEAQRAIAEVQAAILLAKQFPRNRVQAYEEIINECCREGLATVAIYSYSRGGTEITGPSIRLAEALGNVWGNLQSGWRELSRKNGESEVEAWAWDTEKNTRRSVTFHVKHIRNTKKGSYAIEDERDIYELCANQAARRERACILRLIPGDVVEAAVKQCESTLNSKITVTAERIVNMVEAFKAFGVTKEMLEKRVQRRIDTINGPQLVQLTKIYNSLRDNMSAAADWFEVEAAAADGGKPATQTDAVKDKLRKVRTEGKGAETPAHDPDTGEVIGQADVQNQAPTKSESPVSAPAAIPMPSVPGNTAEPDIDGWAQQWDAAVQAAPDTAWLREFRKKNATVLSSFSKRNPVKHGWCIDQYESRLAELSGEGRPAA